MAFLPLRPSHIAQHAKLPLASVQVLATVTSTNTHLKEQCLSLGASSEVLICAAEQQTQGRGRGGKVWLSPEASVTFSLALSMTQEELMQGGLSLVVGCAVASHLTDLGVVGHGVKWPNDILVDGKKLAGILVESQRLKDGRFGVVIGLGLNYQLPPQVLKPDQPFICLSALLGDQDLPSRDVLIGGIAREILAACRIYQYKGLGCLEPVWSKYDVLCGQEVAIIGAGETKQKGVAQGIAADGALNVLINGHIESIYSGEVSVRATSQLAD